MNTSQILEFNICPCYYGNDYIIVEKLCNGEPDCEHGEDESGETCFGSTYISKIYFYALLIFIVYLIMGFFAYAGNVNKRKSKF